MLQAIRWLEYLSVFESKGTVDSITELYQKNLEEREFELILFYLANSDGRE